MARQLYILRHAKSDWGTDAANDFQRPLNGRGVRNARKMGKWMVEQGISPETIISSSALRAWQTAALVCNGLGVDEIQIQFTSALYLADLGTLMETVNNLPLSSNSAMLVGHNPGLDQLVAYLAGNEVPVAPDGKVMATATLAQLELDDDWSAATEGVATLVHLHRAR